MAIKIKGAFKNFEGGFKMGLYTPPTPGFSSTPISGSFAMTDQHIDSTSSEFVMGTGDYQIDFWIKFTGLPGGGYSHSIVDFRTGSGQTQLGVGVGAGGSFGGTTVTTGVWYHYAQSRSSGVIRVFVDGVNHAGDTPNTANYTSNRFRLGGPYNAPNPSWQFKGLISNVRLIKGTPLYFDEDFSVATNDSTIETGTVLLSARGNGFTDESGFGHTFSNAGVTESLVDYPGA